MSEDKNDFAKWIDLILNMPETELSKNIRAAEKIARLIYEEYNISIPVYWIREIKDFHLKTNEEIVTLIIQRLDKAINHTK